jgi:hypothetical protein
MKFTDLYTNPAKAFLLANIAMNYGGPSALIRDTQAISMQSFASYFPFETTLAQETSTWNDFVIPDWTGHIEDNEFVAYKGENYEGDTWTFRFDMNEPNRKYYFQLKGTGFNNDISSWKLGRKLHAEFCDNDLVYEGSDENGKPTFGCLDGDDPNKYVLGDAAGEIAMSNYGESDKVSGVILSMYDPETVPAVTVFTGTDCTGQTFALYTNGTAG